MINATTIKSALVSGVMMAILTVAIHIIGVGDIFSLDVKAIANIGVISLLTSVVSFLKSALTGSEGTIAGIKVK
jgi:hypothetical protein